MRTKIKFKDLENSCNEYTGVTGKWKGNFEHKISFAVSKI
jgi:hypothetical protein